MNGTSIFFSEILSDLLAKSCVIEIYFLKQDIAIILKKTFWQYVWVLYKLMVIL